MPCFFTLAFSFRLSYLNLNSYVRCTYKNENFKVQVHADYFHIYLLIYSPSPEYPAACRRDEWRGEPRRSLQKRSRVAMAEFRLIPHRLRWGASLEPNITMTHFRLSDNETPIGDQHIVYGPDTGISNRHVEDPAIWRGVNLWDPFTLFRVNEVSHT